MTAPYAGNPANCPADIAIPTGSDARNTSSYAPALQQLADRTANIGASTPIGGVGMVTGPTGPLVAMGTYNLPGFQTTYGSIYFGNAAHAGAQTGTNYSFLGAVDGSGTWLNVPSATGVIHFTSANAATLANMDFVQSVLAINAGYGLQVGNVTKDLGGATGAIGLSAVTTAPTGPPTTAGDGIIWSDTHGVHFTNHSNTSPYSSAIGWDSTISGDALWLNPAATGSFTDASMVLGSNGGSATVLNTGTTGGLTVGGSSGASAVWNAQGFAIGNPSTEQASGSAILQFAPGTVPTSCSTSLSACIYDNSATASVSNGLVSMDSKGNRTTLAPQVATLSGTGTSGVDTQVLSDGAYVGFGKTVGNQTLILSSPILSGSACDVDWTCIARVIVAGTAPTTLGNALIQREIDGVTNIAGTVALAGGATTVLQNKAPGGWGSLPIMCTPSYATANTYTIMAQSCATCGTVDWTIKAKLNCQ